MKNGIFFLVLVLALVGCKSAPCPEPMVVEVPVVVRDTVYVVDAKAMAVQEALHQRMVDSMADVNKRLGADLLHHKMVLENARYYLGIVNRNKTQEKFLRGWMNRALSQ